ncbi:MAG: fibronectin type III domain-containing protein [Chloroflexi bacterium]|nr:fibronectin type III domain-containing protein [Chloroflexota bacterium]
MFTRWKFQIGLTVIAVVLAALSAAFLGEPVAYAQGEDSDYVDVELILEVPEDIQAGLSHELNIIVVNNGSRTAYDVEVVVTVVYPEDSSRFLFPPRVPVGVASLENNGYSLRWSIPALAGLQREEITANIYNEILEGHMVGTIFDNSSIPHAHSGEVTTASFDSNPGNNTDRSWAYNFRTNHVSFRAVVGNYSVDVEVDETSPSPGDTINFTITTDRANPYTHFATGTGPPNSPPPIDLKVDIELTEGLTVTGTPSYAPTPDVRADSVSYGDGVFTIGTVGKEKSRRNSVTLPITVASDAAVNEQCLTATLTGNPPPGVGPMDDDISDNVAELCLGDQPAEPFVSGELDIFTVYDCFARQTYPCDGTGGVRVRAVNNNARTGIIVAQDNVTVQVQDIQGRTYDSYLKNNNQQSVTGAETVSWQTGSASHANFTGTREGVRIFFSRIPFNGNLNNWVKVAGEHVTVTDLNGGDPPGDMYIRGATGSAFTQMKSSNDWTVTYSGTSSKNDQSEASAWFAEFSKLGTYVVDYTTIGNRDDTNGDCASKLLPSGVTAAYCDTNTYTFHVGPMADLAVEDGGGSPHVAAGRNALTIIAVNNGPDDSPNSQVTGLPTGADVIHIGQGSYDSATGEWDIGELKVRGYYRSRGEPDRTLVLSASAGDTANVSIANSKNYEVCIGPKSNPVNLAHTTQSDCEAVTDASWNSTPVYDYNTDNSTAKISAAKGTGGGPGAPGMRGAKSNSRSVTIAWDEVEYLYGVPVRHHEVQKYMADVEVWETVSGPLTDAQWTDFNVGSGAMPAYRVRAMNDAGVVGPWSAVFNRLTAQQQGQLAAPRLTAKWTAGDAIRLTWTEPSNQQDAITGYQLEYLAGDTWTLLARLAADETCADDTPRCYEDLGLPAGTERSYRVRAMAGQDPGRWSSEAVTATPPGAPVLWAEPNGSNAILITWDPGSDAVTGFELEASSTGEDGPYSRLARPSGTTRSYSHNTGAINPEARHYRLRACNSAGCGDWTWPVAATTAPQGVPTAPGLTVRSSTASEIKLSWNKPHAGDSEITHYELEHFTDGQNWTDLELYPATATEYVHQAEFGGGTTHRYRVRAVNDVGEGAWSTVRSVSVPAGLPGQPELSFNDATDDSLTLSWTIPPTNGSRITGYRVERNDRIGGFDNWVRIGTTGASVTAYTDRNLYSGDWLCYRVVATSSVGTGAYSEEQCESTTGQYAIDPDPPVLRLSSVSPNRVTIAWDPPPDDGGRPVHSYLYQQADEDGDFDGSCQYASWDRDLWSDACKMVSAGTRTATFSNLTAGTSYQFRVRAETTYSYGDWATAYARLPRASDDPATDDVTEDLQVRLSTTTLTVNEGRGESRYTVRLNKAPKEGESVPLDWHLQGLSAIVLDYQNENSCYGFDFNRDNWSRGCTFALTAEEDRNADNEIVIMEHSIEVGDMEVTGPDVRIEVRDND